MPIFMGMSYRNYVLTGVVDKISKNHDLTLLVIEDSKIERLVKQSGIKYIPLKLGLIQKVIRRSTNFIEKLQYINFYQKHKTNTMSKYIEREKKDILFPIKNIFAFILGCRFDDYSYLSSQYQFFIPSVIKKKIKTFDKVFLLSTDEILDKSILKFCKLNSIECTVSVHSWDNLPARGFMADKPDKLLVWNMTMKEQAKKLHNIEYSDVKIVGVSQFYFYKTIENQTSLELFKKFYAINDNNVVTYTCSAYRVFPDEDLFIYKLIESCKKLDVLLIIRLHPTERHGLYIDKYSDINNVILDKPSGFFAATLTDDIDNNQDEILRFISLMKYSNVIVNLASTISLDAIIFDTPVICISFNIDENITNSWNEASRWYESTHYEDIVKSNAITISNSMEEIENDILLYLNDATYLQKNRIKLAKEWCNIDINSSDKIVESFK
jgi:hypothetical protein